MKYDTTRMGQLNTIVEPCEVISIPAGATPKSVVIRQPGTDGAAMDVWWTGAPDISVGEFVAIQKRNVSGGQYVVIGVSAGSSGALPLTTKGDLLGFSTLPARVPVSGNDGYVLTEDSTEPTGWASKPAAAGGNVWPKAGEANISDTAYTSVDDFLDALAAGDQGIVGEGTYAVDHAGGHGVIASGVIGVKGSGIGVSILTDDDTYTLEVGSNTLEDLTVANTKATGGVAIVNSIDGGEFTRVKATATATSGTAQGFFLWDYGATLKDCEAAATGGATNYAIYLLDSGSSPTATVRGGYFAGDVVADGAGATLHLDGPTITGSATEANSGSVTGRYYNADGDLIQRDNGIDIYLNGDEAGVKQRSIDVYQTGITDHFDNNVFSGFSWSADAGFVTPGNINVTTYPSMLSIYNSAANGPVARAFAYKSVTGGTSPRLLARLSPNLDVRTGLRIDAGNNNDYIELWLEYGSGLYQLKYRYQTGGGGENTIAIWTTGFPVQFINLRLLHLSGTTAFMYYWINTPLYILASPLAITFTPSRAGLYHEHISGASSNERTSFFDWYIYTES